MAAVAERQGVEAHRGGIEARERRRVWCIDADMVEIGGPQRRDVEHGASSATDRAEPRL
jgi:hypothetical protein